MNRLYIALIIVLIASGVVRAQEDTYPTLHHGRDRL